MAEGDSGSNRCSRIEGHPPRLGQMKVVEEEETKVCMDPQSLITGLSFCAGLGLFSPALLIFQHF